MTHRDMGKATLGQLGNRDIPRSKCSTRVCTLLHLGVKGSKQRCNTPHWQDRQLYLVRISCRHDQPVNINHMKY